MLFKGAIPKSIISRLEATMTTLDSTSTMLMVDKLTPVLKELLMTDPWNNQQDPSVKQLSTWLMDPRCTGEKFLYVFAKLGQHVGNQEYGESPDETDDQGDQAEWPDVDCWDIRVDWYVRSMTKIAIEVLATRCPILEGPWELATWTILCYYLGKFGWFNPNDHGLLSDHACNWIFLVISDANLCPSDELRMELILVIAKMVNVHNRRLRRKTLGFKSIMSACSELNLDFTIDDINLGFTDFTRILEQFAKQKFFFRMDQEIASSLIGTKTMRINTLYKDVSFKYALNSNLYSVPNELSFLITLIRTFTHYVQAENKHNYKGRSTILEVSRTLKVIMCNFPQSCQLPQLLSLTAFCIMETMEYLILGFLGGGLVDYNCLRHFEAVLQKVAHVDSKNTISASIIGKEILHNYASRLSEIKQAMQLYDENIQEIVRLSEMEGGEEYYIALSETGSGPSIGETMILELLNHKY